jgi:uncharacterized protein YeaO (DUF488 family)
MTTEISPITVPELGPLLGRLIEVPADLTPGEAALDAARVQMLTTLFEHAGSARELLAHGNVPGARTALGRTAWLGVWERAVADAGSAITAEISHRVREAASVARFPARRLTPLLPGAEERRVLAARLAAAGIGLEAAVPQLEDGSIAWSDALRRTAGELEAAWEQLVATAHQELATWDRRATQIRQWKRPWTPLVATRFLLLGSTTWLGLVLGGYLPAPGWLRPLAQWFWNLPWP